jgi:alkylation response protein AidB-like acyl-CoA dehydrogenase
MRPLLIAFGTSEQKDRLLPGILTGDIAWCQGYSEPGAGSDLASLRSRAVAVENGWRINGQKIWTTRANDANWMFALLRTDTSGAKQNGISMFVFPMDTPGIMVRPIVDLNGGTELCETFLDDVLVGPDSLIGEVNQGWSISRALLGFERLYVGTPKQSAHAIARLHDLITRLNLWDDAAIADTYVQLMFDLEDHNDLYKSMIDEVALTGTYPPEVSLLKISQSELYQRVTDQLLEIGGAYAGLVEPLADSDGLSPANQFLFARPITIYGGSSEIQRNILARRALGLPG